VLSFAAAVLAVVVACAALIAGYWPETDRLADVPIVHLTALTVGLPLLAGSSRGCSAAWMQPTSDRGNASRFGTRSEGGR
jgi:hypothetical protein